MRVYDAILSVTQTNIDVGQRGGHLYRSESCPVAQALKEMFPEATTIQGAAKAGFWATDSKGNITVNIPSTDELCEFVYHADKRDIVLQPTEFKITVEIFEKESEAL